MHEPSLRARTIHRAGAADTMTRTCYGIAVVLVASGLVSLGLGLAAADGWDVPVSWRVAADFGVGFGLVLAAVVYTAARLSLGSAARAVLLGGLAVACVLEVTTSTIQAWQGQPVFFNSTAPNAVLADGVPAFGGVIIVAAAVGLSLAAARRHESRPVEMTLAVRVGAASFLAADLIGVAMIVAGGRAKAAATTAGPVATLAATQASMRLLPAHLVALAGIGLPLLAGLAARTTFSPTGQTRLVGLACAGYLAGATGIVVANLLGLAPLPPATPMTVTAAVIVVAGAAALLAATAAIAAGLIRRSPYTHTRDQSRGPRWPAAR